MMLVALG